MINIVILLVSLAVLVSAFRKIRSQKAAHVDTKTLLGQLPEAYLALDVQGHIIDVNDAYLKLSGYTKRELLGKDLVEAGLLSQDLFILDQLKQIVRKEPFLKETVHVRKDGSSFPLELSVVALHEGDLAYLCIYRDISKRKQTELALQHSFDLLRYVIEHTRSAIAIHDTSLRYLYVSKKYLEEYRLESSSDIIGKHHYEVLPDLPQKWRDVHKRALQGEILSGEDDQYIRSDGKVEYTRWECRPWYAETGSIGGIIIYTEMITKQKEFELELQNTRDYLETLLNNANSSILVWNSEYIVTRSNKAFDDLMEASQSEIIGKKVFEVFHFIDFEVQQQILTSLDSKKKVTSQEIVIPQKDGSFRTILWNATSIYNPQDDSLIATIAQGQDITERKRIEQESQKQLEELKRWYTVMSNREERILELKQEVNELMAQQNKDPRYTVTSEDQR